MQSQPDEKDSTVASLRAQMENYEGMIQEYDQQLVSLSDSLADRDAKILEQEGKIAALTQEIDGLKTSTSWKLTRPVRFLKDRISRPGEAPAITLPRRTIGLPGDLSWEQFEKDVLSKRDQYKGVFVQEPNIDWQTPLYQRPQHLASALGRLGYLTIYRTNNLVVDNVSGFRQIAPNVWLTNSERTDEIENSVHSIYSTSFSLDVSKLKNLGPTQRVVYEYVDQIDMKITGDEATVRQLLAGKEFAFGGGTDFIVATSRKLEEEAAGAVGREKVLYVPNGGDVNHYRSNAHQTVTLPESLVSFRKRYANIVGYFGAIAPWLWYGAVNQLIRMHPDLGFVFIGPDYLHASNRLSRAGNVLYLGPVDYNILPAYARQFDVCFIPFEPGEIAHTTSPLKLFEYFALEKPVVVTSFMDECVIFPEVFHGSTIFSLSEAIQKAIAVKGDPAFKSRLAQLADENSWDERARRLEPIFIHDQH